MIKKIVEEQVEATVAEEIQKYIPLLNGIQARCGTSTLQLLWLGNDESVESNYNLSGPKSILSSDAKLNYTSFDETSWR